MFFWFGISYFVEPLLVAIIAGGFLALAPLLGKVPKGEKGLKAYMALTLIAYFSLLFVAYAFLASTLGFSLSLVGFTVFVLAFAIGQWLIAPWLINLMYRVKPAPELQPIVDKIARRSGIKPPKAMVAEVNIPNAFAYGNFITGKYVAVTRGLLEAMPEDELEAVIGHEVGHHKHRDVWLILALSLAPMFIYYLGRVLMDWGFISGTFGRDERENNGMIMMLVGLVLLAIGIVLNFVLLQFNRLREYYADLHGAKVKGKKEMQRALARIHLNIERIREHPALQKELQAFANSPAKLLFIYAFADMYYDIDEIVERLKNENVNPILEIFMSHPPIPKRLRFLETL